MDENQTTESGHCLCLPVTQLLRLTGADRQKWLHNFCTADIKALEPGQGCEAFVLNVKGKTIAHVIVLMTRFDLTVLALGKPEIDLNDHFDKYIITEDVQVENIGENHRLWYAVGAKLDAMFEKGLSDAALYSHALVRDRSVAIRTAISGSQDWLILVNRTEDVLKWYGGIGSMSEQEFHEKRINSRFPMTGVDVTLERLPQEFQRDDVAISFSKGCYLGQETVARIDAIGHVNYFFVAVGCDSAPLNPGLDLTLDGKSAGVVTSTAGQRGLGFVRRIHAKPGQSFESAIGNVTVI